MSCCRRRREVCYIPGTAQLSCRGGVKRMQKPARNQHENIGGCGGQSYRLLIGGEMACIIGEKRSWLVACLLAAGIVPS